MYTLKPLTERAKRVRERYRNTEPKICIARYRLVTEFYQEHTQLRGILKRACAMKHVFDHLPVRVEDDDVIVGALGTTFRSCAIYPEYSLGSLAREIANGNISSRKYDPYLIDPEDGQYIMDTAEFWEKESMQAIMSEYTVDGFMPHNGSGTTTHGALFVSSGPVGHFCTGYNTAIRKGFGAIRDEAGEKMRRMEEDGIYGTDIDKYYFYKAVAIVC